MINYREQLEKKREGLIRIDKENDNDPYDSNLLSEYAGMKYGFNALMEQTVALAEALQTIGNSNHRNIQNAPGAANEAIDSFKQWLDKKDEGK